MSTAGARVLREDHEDMTREDVLLAWERKIEAEERRSGRFERPAVESREPAVAGQRDAATGAETAPGGAEVVALAAPPGAERRTIRITGTPAPVRRRANVAQRQLAQPDRVALWAFLLGLFLVAVAAGTAHV
jgi:hypothetical protein